MGAPLGARGPVAVVAMRIEAVALGRPVVVCGMGPGRAAAAGVSLAERLAPAGAVVVTGVCGALDPALGSGTVVMADAVRRAGGDAVTLAPLPGLRQALQLAGLPVVGGTVVSAAAVVRGAARRELAREGAVVDKEAAALVEVLGDRPVAVVRVVADTPRSGMVRGGLVALRALRRVGHALDGWSPPGWQPVASG